MLHMRFFHVVTVPYSSSPSSFSLNLHSIYKGSTRWRSLAQQFQPTITTTINQMTKGKHSPFYGLHLLFTWSSMFFNFSLLKSTSSMYIIYTLSLQEHKCNNTLIYYPDAIDSVDEHGFTKKIETMRRKNFQHKATISTIGIHTRK